MGFDSQTISFRIDDADSASKGSNSDLPIPSWIRNNAKWWSDGSINDKDFVLGIQYLAQEKVIIVEKTPSESILEEIPQWVKINAKWWSEGLITDEDFIKGVEYLAQNGIIQWE